MTQDFLPTFTTTLWVGIPCAMAGALLGPALGRFSGSDVYGLTLEEAREVADEIVPHNIGRAFRALKSIFGDGGSSHSDDSAPMLFAGVLLIASVALYMKYRNEVILGVFLLAMLLSALTLLVLIIASRKSVVAASQLSVASYVIPFLYTCVGVADTAFLWSPPAGGRLFNKFTGTYLNTGQFGSLPGLGFVVYQIMGAVAFAILAVITIGYCLATLSSIYLATGMAGRWLWACIYFATRPLFDVLAIFVLVPAAALSLFMTSGWAFSLVTHHAVVFPSK